MPAKENPLCEAFAAEMWLYLSGELEEDARQTWETHLAVCPHCRTQLQEARAALSAYAALSPADVSDTTYAQMIDHATRPAPFASTSQAKPRSSYREWLAGLFAWIHPAPHPALAVGLVLLGIAIGVLLTGTRLIETAQLRTEVKEVRALLTVSLLNQPSASERLKGIRWSTRIDQADQDVVAALLNTLRHDANVNVRLAAADALVRYQDQAAVRRGIIEALAREPSPLVQLVLIDLLTAFRDRQATEALEQLLRDDALNPTVRHRAQQSLQRLL